MQRKPKEDPMFTEFQRVMANLHQAHEAVRVAGDQAEAELRRRCPDLRDEALHEMLRKDEAL